MQQVWRWLGIFLLIAAFPRFAAAVQLVTLDNGLTVLLEERHATSLVSIQVFVRTGSIHEQEYLGSGISHFFEHILFGGTTANRSEEATRELLEALGNQSNAYTTTDHTAYYIDTTAEHWRTAVTLLADWMFHNTIAEEEFLREKGVVQRELEQGLDNPAQVLFHTLMATRFQVHPASYPVIGHQELVQKVRREDIVRYYQRMYAPNNMILVVVGAIRTDEAMQHIRTVFGEGERRLLPAISLPQEPPQLSKRTVVKELPIQQAHLAMSFRTVPLTHPDLYPLDVLASILSEGDSARLVHLLQNVQQLVYSIRANSWTPAYTDGSLTVWATLDAERLPAAEAAILQELGRLREELVTAEELARAKRQTITEHLFLQQTVHGRAQMLGTDMLATYDPHFSQLYVEKIQQVTADAIRRVARQYFQEDTLSHVVVRPPRHSAAVTPAETLAAPVAGALQKYTLANGMTLLLKRNPALPLVSMQAYFQGGVRVETPQTNGLSQFMAKAMVKGTATRRAEDIATIFDAMGGSITTGSGNHSFFVMASCLRDDLWRALEVFADVIMHPTFPPPELDNVRRLMAAELASQQDDWQEEVAQLFRQTFFTVSPYRMSPAGNATALQTFQRDDVVAFHQRYAVPNNMVLALVGDIDLEATRMAVEQMFAAFSPRPLTLPQVAAEPFPTQERRQVKRTEKQVAAIHIGFPGTTMQNIQDSAALQILDAVLSGVNIPGGWLHRELRGRQLVYTVHAFNWLGLEPGYFGIYAATQPHQVDEVIAIILEQIERARAGHISEEEMTRARAMALVAMQMEQETNEQLARDAALHELYGLGYDYAMHEQARLQQVTRQEVQRVAQTYFHHPTIVVTTPRE